MHAGMHRLFVGVELTPKVIPLDPCIFVAFLRSCLKCRSIPRKSGKDFRTVPDYVTSTISKQREGKRGVTRYAEEPRVDPLTTGSMPALLERGALCALGQEGLAPRTSSQGMSTVARRSHGLAQLRADTPGSHHRIHFNNAGMA